MSDYVKSELDNLNTEFINVQKKVNQARPVSAKETKREEYKKDLITTFNNIINYVNRVRATPEEIPYIKAVIVSVKEKIRRAFKRLHCPIKVPSDSNVLHLINPDILDSDFESEDSSEEQLPSSDNIPSTSTTTSSVANNQPPGDSNDNSLRNTQDDLLNNSGNQSPDRTLEMAITDLELLGIASKNITRTYNGNPLTLNSFVNSVKLVKRFATPAQEQILIEFVISKLEARAEEFLPENPQSVEEILKALKDNIKPENSEIITGRITALKLKNNNYQDFSKEIEELSEALRRSLINEGISSAKAQEMTIKETVKVCRAATKNDVVDTVMAASVNQFQDPKDAIALFVIESAAAEKKRNEKQVFAINAYHNKKNHNYKNGKRFGRKFNKNKNNYRGNGSGSKYFNKDNTGNRNGRNPRNVRYTENADAPQQRSLGAVNQE